MHSLARARPRTRRPGQHRTVVWRGASPGRRPRLVGHLGRAGGAHVTRHTAGLTAPETRKVTSLLSAERASSILADLVRAPSQNPHDGEAAVASIVVSFL